MATIYANDFESGTLGADVTYDDGTLSILGTYVAGRTGLGLGGTLGSSEGITYAPAIAISTGTASVDFMLTDRQATSPAPGLVLTVLRAYNGFATDSIPPSTFWITLAGTDVYQYRLGTFRSSAEVIPVTPVFDVWHTARYDFTPAGWTFSLLDADGASLWSSGVRTYVDDMRPAGLTAVPHEPNPVSIAFGSVLDNFAVASAVEAVTRLWPRDDALGLGSAPRLYPPPKRGRVVGGYQ